MAVLLVYTFYLKSRCIPPIISSYTILTSFLIPLCAFAPLRFSR